MNAGEWREKGLMADDGFLNVGKKVNSSVIKKQELQRG